MGAAPRRVIFQAILVFLVCQGCTVGPDYIRPDPAAPDAWRQKAVRGLRTGHADLQTWWTCLNDPLLSDLIERARQANFDVKQAHARVMQSRSLRAIAAGERVPDIDAVGSYTRARISEGISPVMTPGLKRTENFYAAGGIASWEIDLWGRIRRNVESADYSLAAAFEDLRDVLVVLYADVAINYVQLRTFQARIQFAEENVKRQEATLLLTEERFKAGLVPQLDVRQAELNLARTESSIPRLKETLKQTVHRLGVLTGNNPGTLYEELSDIRSIPKPPDDIGVGVPADLIRQRPDIRSAERRLASQTAQIGVATALLYPQFTLFGDLLFESARGSLSGIFTAGNISWSYGPSFTWNIFDGDRIRSNIRFEEAVADEAYFDYRQTVLEALEDVENSMVAYVQECERRDKLYDSVAAAKESVNLVTTLYRTGLVDFQNVLDMERSLFEQQDEFESSQGTVTTNLINIYRALGGGGWQSQQEQM